MSEKLRKRGPDPEGMLDSIEVGEPKRFHCEETGQFLDLLQLDKTLSDDDEEECALSEERVNGVMRSLEEEIAATCSTLAPDISSDHEGQTRDSDTWVDLCFLLEASDDELGIPPSPVLDRKEEVCPSPKETSLDAKEEVRLSPKETSEGLLVNPYLKSLGENWHFEDNFDNYQQFKLYEDAWHASQLQDYMNRDLVSHGMLFDGDFSAAWRLETAGCM